MGYLFQVTVLEVKTNLGEKIVKYSSSEELLKKNPKIMSTRIQILNKSSRFMNTNETNEK